MELAANLLITALLLVQIVLIGWIAVTCRGKIRDLQSTVRTFITPKGPEEASPLATIVDVGADMVARAVTARIKTSLMGSQSGVVRQEKAVDGAIAEDLARAAHPLAGTLLDAMPELRKTLRRNPGLLDFALQKLAAANPQSADKIAVIANENHIRRGKING